MELIKKKSKKINILIYGAGEAGKLFYKSISNNKIYTACGFVDDNKKIQNTYIEGLEVFSKKKIISVINSLQIKGIIFAMPSIHNEHLRELSKFFLNQNIFIAKVPEISELITNQKQINQISQFNSKDFLARSEINTKLRDYNINLKNKVVAVSGSGGSIGSELCKQLLELGVKKIILIENHEFSLFKIVKQLENSFKKSKFNYYLCDVKNRKKLSQIFADNKVTIVYHAAAYKHVELLENNIIEAISNNVLGTHECLNACMDTKVEKFILISTDKAVNPKSIMGATKRIAEIIVSSFSKQLSQKYNLKTCIVRFGNVLRSHGSVIPIFEKQIQKGGPVTITHPKVSRFFMTINEAVKLVILASNILDDNNTYILDMGRQRKIIDLAHELILMNGFIPVIKKTKNIGEINIIFTGLKKGEKLKEELHLSKELLDTPIPKIKFVKEPLMKYESVVKMILNIKLYLKNNDTSKLLELLIKNTGLKR